jgi:hypothetical protein
LDVKHAVHAEMAELIHRYVRDRMSPDEAAQFEEQYFADPSLARLVEAEQVLVLTPDLIGEGKGAAPAPPRRPAATYYAWAASIMLACALAAILALGQQLQGYRADANRLAAHIARLEQPLLVVTAVPLSSMRAAAAERPAYRFALPTEPGAIVRLTVPVPPGGAGEARTVSLSLSQAGGPTVWSREQRIGARQKSLELALGQDALEPGAYALSVADDGGRPLASYAFEVLPAAAP